jgi:predicted component of type VI protein secretion system
VGVLEYIKLGKLYYHTVIHIISLISVDEPNQNIRVLRLKIEKDEETDPADSGKSFPVTVSEERLNEE